MMRAWFLAVALVAAPGLLGAGGLAAVGSAAPDAKRALAATGTIQRFDAATRTLILKTTRGSESFVVAESTTIHRGAKVATPQDLGKWNGSPAKVRYSEAGGRRTASSVMVGAH